MNLFKRRREEADIDEENTIEGERVLGSVNRGITLQNRIANWAVIIGACLFAVILLYKYYAGMYRHYEETKTAPKDVTRTLATTTLPPLSLPDPAPATATPAAGEADKLPPLQPLANPAASARPASTGAGSSGATRKSQAELVRERRLKREVRFNLDVAGVGASTAAGEGGPSAEEGTAAASTRPAATSPVQPAGSAVARAYMLPDPTLMMTRGKVIPCTVIPAIDTTLTGTVTCVTAVDATGADNTVIPPQKERV